MFTWICPQCGREVPPAYTECPDCAAKAAGAGAPPPQQPAYQPTQAPAQPPVPQQPYQPAYQQPVYQQPQYQPPQYQPPVYQQPQYQPPPPPPPLAPPPAAVPPMRPEPVASTLFAASQPPPHRHGAAGLPTWLLTILCTAGFAILVVGAYWLLGKRSPTPSTSVESPAAKPGAAANPWQTFIEVSGLRFVEDPKHKGKILAKFLVTNHSSGDLSGLAGNVTIWASTKRSEEDAQGTFSFITNLDAYESKEVTTPLTTKLKVYELPDWQKVTTDLQITAPKAPGSGGLP